MIKAEPRTILHFIWNHFDLVRDLFEIQTKDDLIRKETLALICEKHESDIRQKLLDYKIIRSVNDDFEFQTIYFNLIEFLLFEFRPLLPEEIEKYRVVISDLFRKIQDDIRGDKNLLLDRIRAISNQIKEFSDSVEKSTIRLLNETRDLKANVEKIEQIEKIQRATHWIENYIAPLNTILDNNHSESISNKLLDISEYVNQKRLDFPDEGIRRQFEKLYFQLAQTTPDLVRQSKILTNELLPLMERIRTEFSIISGWIEFLQAELFRRPHVIPTPKLMKAERGFIYSDTFYLNTKEYFEQFANTGDIFIEEGQIEVSRWLFNKDAYKDRLIDSLPIEDFFIWCQDILSQEDNPIKNEKYFALISLLFEDDLIVGFDPIGNTTTIKTESSIFDVPKLSVKANEVS